ncbi:MAG: hypothetical protein VX794_04850 [Nitrospinota bacterium]|nr:hypothetical protein [Nitrospinota bacterium]
MQKLIMSSSFLLFCFSFFCFPINSSSNKWTGTIIDAHSQYGCKTDGEDILYAIRTFGVKKTLLSARGGCSKDETPIESQLRTLNLVKDLKKKADFFISSKLAGLGHPGEGNKITGLKWFVEADKLFFKNSIGFGEIIVQHADHDHAALTREGLQSNLESSRIKKVISVMLKRKKPVILHLELNDSEKSSSTVLSQLRRLLKNYPQHNFVLIHMAQASAVEVMELVRNFPNIYFLTSHTNALNEVGKIKRKRIGEVAQKGWINLFNVLQKGAPYRGWFKEYFVTMRWKEKWKNLFVQFPDRFVFAMDNVFAKHWRKKRYQMVINIWRKAFSQLPKEVAVKVSCENANRLWNLKVTCLAK